MTKKDIIDLIAGSTASNFVTLTYHATTDRTHNKIVLKNLLADASQNASEASYQKMEEALRAINTEELRNQSVMIVADDTEYATMMVKTPIDDGIYVSKIPYALPLFDVPTLPDNLLLVLLQYDQVALYSYQKGQVTSVPKDMTVIPTDVSTALGTEFRVGEVNIRATGQIHGHNTPKDNRYIDHMNYYRDIDNNLVEQVKKLGDEAEIVMIGLSENLTLFRDIQKKSHQLTNWELSIEMGPEKIDLIIEKLLKNTRTLRTEQVNRIVNNAKSAGTYVDDVNELEQAVMQEQIATLILNSSDRLLDEDKLNQIVVSVLRYGGYVFKQTNTTGPEVAGIRYY